MYDAHSDVNDTNIICQWQIHAWLKFHFWNYPYRRHNILKCQVSTINKQHYTLSAVFQDDIPSHWERFVNVSWPSSWSFIFIMTVREPSPPLKVAMYEYPSQNYFLQLINIFSAQSYATFPWIREFLCCTGVMLVYACVWLRHAAPYVIHTSWFYGACALFECRWNCDELFDCVSNWYMCEGEKVFVRIKIRNFHTSLVSLSMVLTKVMAKTFKLLCT